MVAALVTADWLLDHLSQPSLRVVDASWYLPAQQRDAWAEYRAGHIPGAVFFDIDAVADHTTGLPHMLPSAAVFEQTMAELGIGSDTHVVVYDGMGVFSAPRLWWTLRVFGHQQVSVLNGGLPAWVAAGGAITDHLGTSHPPPAQAFSPRVNPLLLRSREQMLANLDSGSALVLDARPAGRFYGREAEPRAGLRSGHIPGSCNLPFAQLLQAPANTMLDAAAITQQCAALGINIQQPIIASCGSGITAAIIALALYTAGNTDVAVYDGSWAEWGADPNLPLATT